MTLVDSQPTVQRGAPDGPPIAAAKLRILETATRLFYQEGIHSVGVDKLIAEASVTKATFYKHFGAKDKLILEYLEVRHQVIEQSLADLQESQTEPLATIDAILDILTQQIRADGFRGCPFVNAAAEFADPRHPVREAVAAHRDWYTEQLTDLLRGAGHSMPGDAADEVMLARDGAMTGGYAGDPISATAALHRAVERVLSDITS